MTAVLDTATDVQVASSPDVVEAIPKAIRRGVGDVTLAPRPVLCIKLSLTPSKQVDVKILKVLLTVLVGKLSGQEGKSTLGSYLSGSIAVSAGAFGTECFGFL